MTKENDFYWTESKDEYKEKIKRLSGPYDVAIWDYLKAYIIRGEISADIETWSVCHNLYKTSGLLASNISLNRIAKDLKIGRATAFRRLDDLDKANHIIKYISKNINKKLHNTNIYIVGINSVGYKVDGNITRDDDYFLLRDKEMTATDRNALITLYDKQLKIGNEIKVHSKKLQEIHKRLFNKKDIVIEE